MNKYNLFGIILIVFLLSKEATFAQMKIDLSEDAYTAGGENATVNFGAEGRLVLKNRGIDDKFNRKVFLKFNLEKSPEIKTAVLYVYGRAYENEKNKDQILKVRVSSTDIHWEQGSITGANQPERKDVIGSFEIKQAAKPEWYAVVLDADKVELARKNGWLSLCLDQSNKNSLSAYISSLEDSFTGGKPVNKPAYLEINKELPERTADKSTDTRKITQKKAHNVKLNLSDPLKIYADKEVSMGKSATEFANSELLVRGSGNTENVREVYIAYDVGKVKDFIAKATLYIFLKSPEGKAKIHLYEVRGNPIDKGTNWNNKPITASSFAEVDVSQSDGYSLYELDVTEYARLNQVRGDQFFTICARDYEGVDIPLYIGGSASNSNQPYLVLNMVDYEQLKHDLPIVNAPDYPDEKENEEIFEKWKQYHPINGSQWIPDIWKKYIKQNGSSRLHDFSYAGYAYGEKPTPEIKGITLNVNDFGALPDDDKDDTDAIQQALNKIGEKGGVLFFPKGKYIINGDPSRPKYLSLNASNVVIRGEGSGIGGTVLFMANKYLPAKGYGDYVFNIGKRTLPASGTQAPVVNLAKRGEFTLQITNADKFAIGDQIEITMRSERDTESLTYRYDTELSQMLTYPLQPDPTWGNYGKYTPYSCYNQIIAINGNALVLKQPLKIDIDPKFRPRVEKKDFYENIGVENIKIEGNWQGPYEHHGNREMDYGWCGLAFFNTANSWVSDVAFENLTCDMKFWNSKNITAEKISISGTDGHHGITMNSTSSILVRSSAINAHRTHHLGVSGGTEGCVFKDIEINDSMGAIDFHGGGFAMANLYDNIKDASISGAGAVKNMPHSGRENTFWNIIANQKAIAKELTNQFFQDGLWNYPFFVRQRGNVSLDCYQLYPGSIVIGVYKPNTIMYIGDSSNDRDTDFLYVEGLNKQDIIPSSLYDAQFDFRINKDKYLLDK